MPRLTGQRIVLREFRQNDIDGMRMWIEDPMSTRYLSDVFTVPQTFEQTVNFLDSLLNGKGADVHLVIADKDTLDYLGQCDLMHISMYSRKAELGIVLTPDAQCKGYGTEAINLLLELAFDWMNLNRVYLNAYADNVAAQCCYEKCGFVREGVLKEHYYAEGVYSDVVCMGILRKDWQARRGVNK